MISSEIRLSQPHLVVTSTTESAATSSPPHHRLLLNASSSMLAIFTGKLRSSRHEPDRTDSGPVRCKAGGTAITAVKLQIVAWQESSARTVLAANKARHRIQRRR